MKALLFTSLLLFLSINFANACDCVGSDFLASAKKADAVLLVQMLSTENYSSHIGKYGIRTFRRKSVRVKVVESHKGDAKPNDEIIIFGDDEAACRMELEGLIPSNFYLINISEGRDQDHGEGVIETPADYSISICGENILSYYPKKRMLVADIYKVWSRLPYYSFEYFMERLKSNLE